MIVKALKKALVQTLDNEKDATVDKEKKENYTGAGNNQSITTQFSKEENPARIKELEALIFQLSTKITVLVEKVHNMENYIVSLTTAHEELLHVLENNIEQMEREEDKVMNGDLNSKESKFGLI